MHFNGVTNQKSDHDELFTWRPKDGEGFEVGKYHQWEVIAITLNSDGKPIQKVKCDKIDFYIQKLDIPELISPSNGLEFVTRYEFHFPKLVWDHGQRTKNIEMEIFLVEHGKEDGTPLSKKGLDLVSCIYPGLMMPGRYRWFVRAYKEDQVTESEHWEFELKKNFALHMSNKIWAKYF